MVASCHWAKGSIGEQSGAPTVFGNKRSVATGDESGPRDITLSLGDYDVTTNGCKPWQLRS